MNLLVFEKLGRFGVLPRSAVKNGRLSLRPLLRQKLVRKVHKKGRVFYEITEKGLPLLDSFRELLLRRAVLQNQVTSNAKFYRALLEDLRFLDEHHPMAHEFQFLGDWQLRRPVVPSQLELSKARFYRGLGVE